ncbi:MAG: sugar phosphate isomerase/epimerase [Clostridia bacterium]|nr:sugar phosphate isomerase/epimerase [Clostridia bacterium]
MNKTEYGIQMYSLHDITAEHLKEALKAVADMGYKYIEFAGFFGHSPEEIKSWLKEYKLTVTGSHIGLDQIKSDKIEETLTYHKAIGCDNLIVPAADWSDLDKFNDVINTLNEADEILKKNGLRLGYHNHSDEFLPTPDGIIFQDELIKRTSIEFEIDVFWLYNAGIDVVSYLEKYKERIKVIHLKDGNICPPENRIYGHSYKGVEEFSVGMGSVPVSDIISWANKNNVLIIVESEGLNPTGPEEVARCMEYLKTLD